MEQLVKGMDPNDGSMNVGAGSDEIIEDASGEQSPQAAAGGGGAAYR